jgi:hypothetical protein
MMMMTVSRHMMGRGVMGADAKEARESRRMTVSGQSLEGQLMGADGLAIYSFSYLK